MLTKKQLKQLRNEITLNSLFLKDYNNSLFIKEKTACNFFDGYIEYLYEIAADDNFNSDNVLDVIDRYDNINNLYNYYTSMEYDPLLQDDYIASTHINNSDGIVIYDVIDDYRGYYVLSAHHYLSGLCVLNTRITKNKIYIDRQGDTYFIKDKTRYYLNTFMRCNYGIDR